MVASGMFSSSEIEFALRFMALGRALFGQRAVRDAFLWHEPRGGLSAAWVMRPVSMANIVGAEEEFIRGRAVSFWLKKTFDGLSKTDFDYEDTVGVYDLFGRMSNTFLDVPSLQWMKNSPSLTFIPEGGWPWPAKDDVYFSASKKKVLRSERPDWLIKIPDNDDVLDQYGIDLCALMGARLIDGSEAGLGEALVADFPGSGIIVTHAVSARSDKAPTGGFDSVGAWRAAGRSVKACGGLLFPSLAVGPIPATNFGTAILVARVGLALQGVKPYKPRGDVPVRLYDTDAWTGRVGDYAKGWAASAFRQMHGHSEYLYNIDNHVWMLGAPESVSAMSLHPETIETIQRLNTELKRRFGVWKRGMEVDQVSKAQQKVEGTKARYAYLEAKVNGITPMSAYPVAICPGKNAEKFSAWLTAAGWRGRLVKMNVPDDVLMAIEDDEWLRKHFPGESSEAFDRREAVRMWASLEFGWHVADEIRKLGLVVKVEP